MKKDIQIPEAKNIHLAAVLEYNEAFRTEEWNVYLFNKGEETLETVLITSYGKESKSGKKTSTLRHKIDRLPTLSFAKIEFLENQVLVVDNHFDLCFFKADALCEKKFVFKANTLKKTRLNL